MLKSGRNNDDSGKKSSIELNGPKKSKQRIRFKPPALACHIFDPMTLMNAPRVPWYDFVEVSR